MPGELIGQRVEAIVVDLELQFFVEAIQHLCVNAVVDRLIAEGSFGHRSAPARISQRIVRLIPMHMSALARKTKIVAKRYQRGAGAVGARQSTAVLPTQLVLRLA